MQCQLIQNFIKLPGIIGFSLTGLHRDTASKASDADFSNDPLGTSSPGGLDMPPGQRLPILYSVGFAQGPHPEQRPLLVQGIQQIIQTTPESLEHCTFQFGTYQVALHKADNGVILLVVSEGMLSNQHSKAISELMHFIKADYAALVDSIQAINADTHQAALSTPSPSLPVIPIHDLLEAMNNISQATSRYLGPRLVADHWRAAQSNDRPWLSQQFRIATDGTLSSVDSFTTLTPAQLADLRFWVQRFHQRCIRFIRDYDTLLEQALPQHQWQLLFGE